MPKIVDHDLEKQKILMAFQRCILSKPMHLVTVRDIAGEAGISHAKIFSYFSGKKEIVMAYAAYIAEMYSRAFEGVTEKVKSETGGKRELLRGLIGELYEIDRENIVEKLYAQIYTLGQYDPEIREVVREAYADWRRSIKVLLRSFDPDASDSEVRSVLVLVEGILIYRMNDALSREEAQSIVTDLFCG